MTRESVNTMLRQLVTRSTSAPNGWTARAWWRRSFKIIFRHAADIGDMLADVTDKLNKE